MAKNTITRKSALSAAIIAFDFLNMESIRPEGMPDVDYMEVKQTLANMLEQEVSERFIELPVDADGEAIHVRDVMEWPITGETFEVVGIGDGTLFYIENDGVYALADWTDASTKRHHQYRKQQNR